MDFSIDTLFKKRLHTQTRSGAIRGNCQCCSRLSVSERAELLGHFQCLSKLKDMEKEEKMVLIQQQQQQRKQVGDSKTKSQKGNAARRGQKPTNC